MTELVNDSKEQSNDSAVYAASLLHHYSFDLGGYTIAQLLLHWQEHYPTHWTRLATIEALYQGRYKAISVEQILALWQRRSQPIYHFNHEFERLVCENLPKELVPSTAPLPQQLTRSTASLDPTLPYHSVALQLPSFEKRPVLAADAMLALKTLHAKEAAGQAVADLSATQNDAEASNAPTQAYSYKLRSAEPESAPSLQEPDEAVAQRDRTDPSQLETPDDKAATGTDAPLQADSIAPTNQQSEASTQQTSESASTLAIAASSDRERPVPSIAAQSDAIARILQQLNDQELSATTVLPGFGLTAHTLKPKLQLHLTARYQPLWLSETSSKQPIHQFTPESESSEFHSKLKAVAQPEELEEETLAAPPEI